MLLYTCGVPVYLNYSHLLIGIKLLVLYVETCVTCECIIYSDHYTLYLIQKTVCV
jgi:hypothetical protein